MGYSREERPSGQKEGIDLQVAEHKMMRKALDVTIQLIPWVENSSPHSLHTLCLDILSAVTTRLSSISDEKLVMTMMSFSRLCCEQLVFYSFFRD